MSLLSVELVIVEYIIAFSILKNQLILLNSQTCVAKATALTMSQ